MIDDDKKAKLKQAIIFVGWIFFIAIAVSGLLLLFMRPIEAIGYLIFAFCLCPMSSKIFQKLKSKIKINIQIPAIILSYFLLFGFIKLNAAVMDSINKDKTNDTPAIAIVTETAITEETTISILETITSSETTTTPETTTHKTTTTKAATKSTTAETTTAIVKYETNQLFDDVFMLYCDLSKVVNFDMACEKLKTFTQYKIDYTEPTDDDLGEITLTDDNGNYVYIISYPLENLGVETITLIGYVDGKTGNEIAVSDEIHTVSKPEYHIHDKSKEKPNRKASSLQELIEFMFPVKTVETTNTTTTIETTTTPIITTTTIIETEPPETEAPAPVIQERHVYVAASGQGERYHSNPNCSKMNGNVIEYSVDEAESRGYTPCKKCY